MYSTRVNVLSDLLSLVTDVAEQNTWSHLEALLETPFLFTMSAMTRLRCVCDDVSGTFLHTAALQQCVEMFLIIIIIIIILLLLLGLDPEKDHREEEDFSSSAASPGLQVSPPPGHPADPPQRQLKSLERQLQVLRGVAQLEVEPDSLIRFHDVDFPLEESIVAAKKKKKKERAGKGEHQVFGTPDMDEPASDTCCAGCGAVLHCTAVDVPGYLPSEKFRVLQQEERLGGATCQRCHLLTHHHKALNLQVSSDQYRAIVQQLRPLRALVLLVVDLLDVPDSIVPNLPALVGTNKHIVVLGNKIDLLPGDAPNYLQRIKRQLYQYCHNAGFGRQVTDIHLISAKTGYGIEGLISSLQRSWKYKGDVYLVGSANAGKSTLFNALLESDYCKSKASDLIHKATISPWPGEHTRFHSHFWQLSVWSELPQHDEKYVLQCPRLNIMS